MNVKLAMAAAYISSSVLISTHAHAADLIIHNSNIYTADDQRSTAQALVVEDGGWLYCFLSVVTNRH